MIDQVNPRVQTLSDMHDRDDHQDRITDAVLSGSTFERIRYTEATVFNIRVTRALALQAGLLGLLALVFPLYVLYPSSVAGYVPSLDPFVAAPKVVLLGFLGMGLEVVAAGILVGLYVYRRRREPLTEQQARTVLDVQQIAAGLSLVTGGLAIAITVTLFSLGVFGESALGTYLTAIASTDVFAQSDAGLSVALLAALSWGCCLAVLVARTGIARATRR